jgi:SAM-dependent methyltransferase
MLESPIEYERMAAVEQQHWWYRSLHTLVLRTIRRYYRDRHDVEILDAGCGTGGLLLFLQSRGYRHVRGFDLSEHATRNCHGRGLPVRQASLLDLQRLYEPQSVDVIVSTDTLYFLTPDDRREFVSQCVRVLRNGGLLLLNLPASEAFRGIHDLSVGIRDRFSRQDIRAWFAGSSWAKWHAMYWPFLLSPAVLAVRWWQRRRLRRSPNVAIVSDVDLPPRWLNRSLFAITRLENRCLPWKPFGSSLFVVAQKSPSVPESST